MTARKRSERTLRPSTAIHTVSGVESSRPTGPQTQIQNSAETSSANDDTPVRRLIACLAVTGWICAVAALHGAVKFTSNFSAPDARTVSFKGQKVAALVMSDSFNLRMSAEEALARELTARGMMGIAAYKAIPKEELQDVERAKAWFDSAK